MPLDAISTPRRVPAGHYPVVIVGGGINGVGLFRDLCLQGVACLLIERADFCAGASAAPSRLIHGGIKYLETGELRLVRQSTLERNRLLVSAPHCVKPIETVVPARSWLGGIVPSAKQFLGLQAKLADRGLLILAGGVTLFDWFGRHHRTMPRASFAWGRRFKAMFPDLPPELVGAASYYDAKVTMPERLGLELVLDGLAAEPASLALNDATVARDQGDALLVRDRLTGVEHCVSADIVVNAAGPWIDSVNQALGINSAYIGGQKGSHLVVDNPALVHALGDRMLYFGAADGRIALLYAYLGNVLVGSTDLPVASADDAVCEDAEIDYMIASIAEMFPTIPITRDQVLYRYCGVRPLPRSETSDPGAVSRDHSIREDRLPGTDVPILSLVGGKWTTFRGFAEEAADRVLGRLGLPRRIDTGTRPIGGGADYPRDPQTRARLLRLIAEDVAPERAQILFERYGTRAADIAAWCGNHGDTPLDGCPGFSAGELDWIVRHELVSHLGDLLFRRTEIALSGKLDHATIAAAGGVAAAALGWDRTRLDDEIATVVARATTQNGVRLAMTGDRGETP